LHGGQLHLESEVGSGSCFYFTLPAVAMPEEKEGRKLESRSSTPARAKILVVDDDPAAMDLLESQLDSAGYEVILCSQPQNAIEIAAELQPAAITLDIVMLPVNGWDVLSGLKGDPRTAKIPVVVVTVMDQRNAGGLLGADDYIVKPVDRAILVAAMDRCLNHRGKIERENAILVVEDDPAACEFIREVLSSNGYEVETAADGAQAREHVKASLPALVILDLILPKLSGLELLAEWRSEPRTADLPVWVLTNKDLTQNEKEYLRVNTKALFSKQEQWLDALMKQIKRAVPSAVAGESR
jgi:DNA-binding response OmpR family regulator